MCGIPSVPCSLTRNVPTLPIAEVLAGLLAVAAHETTSEHEQPRPGLPQVTDQLQDMVELLESTTSAEVHGQQSA